ncbi:unnamed protein product [Arabis nemorensis]|uniref:Uncharacterized protein n=1 Tax=Arabis nemorensis TaxID=586526 RepID=A0A565BLG6_9BRAS|nr:unnamed protein product [Arabis nemorensis]
MKIWLRTTKRRTVTEDEEKHSHYGKIKDDVMQTKSLELSDLILDHGSQEDIVSILTTDLVIQPQQREASSSEDRRMATWTCPNASLDHFPSHIYSVFAPPEQQFHTLHEDVMVELIYTLPTASDKKTMFPG